MNLGRLRCRLAGSKKPPDGASWLRPLSSSAKFTCQSTMAILLVPKVVRRDEMQIVLPPNKVMKIQPCERTPHGMRWETQSTAGPSQGCVRFRQAKSATGRNCPLATSENWSVKGRFCCKSRLRQAAKRDSVVVTRFLARSIHDGPSEE
jgi:hypothetical protein